MHRAPEDGNMIAARDSSPRVVVGRARDVYADRIIIRLSYEEVSVRAPDGAFMRLDRVDPDVNPPEPTPGCRIEY